MTVPGNNPSPTLDFVFRKLFGSEENKDLLISLINSIVEPDYHLTDVKIKNPFNLADYLDAKETIVDIKAQDQDGLWYDLEMQVLGYIIYGKRAIYYMTKVHADQLSSGREFSELRPTIGIHFLDFNVFKDQRMVRRFVFKDIETNEAPEELRDLQLYFVEMRKLHIDWPETGTARDKWVAFLKQGETLHQDNLPIALRSDPSITKAVAALERMGEDPKAREVYESEEKARMIDSATIQYAEERAERRGEARGMLRGQQHLLRRQLTRHLGAVPQNVAASLDTLTLEQLEDLGEALFDLNSYSDVEDWLSGR